MQLTSAHGWQTAIGMLPGALRRRVLTTWPQHSIGIGRHTLSLDTSKPHERRYFEVAARRKKTIDMLIGERFIKPGDTVLDAGANIGFTSLAYLALGAGHVHAVEPVAGLCARISRTKDERLTVHQVCLSDHDGSQPLLLSSAHDQGNYLSAQMVAHFPEVFGASPATETVRVTRADALFPGISFDFWEVDVEGSEAALLDGARELLSRRPPSAIQIEIYPDYFEAVHGRLTRHYRQAYRAASVDGALVLGDFGSKPKGSPMFVYTDQA